MSELFMNYDDIISVQRYGDEVVTSGQKKQTFDFLEDLYTKAIILEHTFTIAVDNTGNAAAVNVTNHAFKDVEATAFLSELQLKKGRNIKDQLSFSDGMALLHWMFAPSMLSSNPYYMIYDINHNIAAGASKTITVKLFTIVPYTMLPGVSYRLSIDMNTFSITDLIDLTAYTACSVTLSSYTIEPFLLLTPIPQKESNWKSTQETLNPGANFLKKIPRGPIDVFIIHNVPDPTGLGDGQKDYNSPFSNVSFKNQNGTEIMTLEGRLAAVLSQLKEKTQVLITSSGVTTSYAHKTVMGQRSDYDDEKIFVLPPGYELTGDNKIRFDYLGTSAVQAKFITVSYRGTGEVPVAPGRTPTFQIQGEVGGAVNANIAGGASARAGVRAGYFR